MELSMIGTVNRVDAVVAASALNAMDTLETARVLLRDYGIHCIDYKRGAKKSVVPGWQDVRAEGDELTARFGKPTNMGILLGEASNNLADVDLDCDEAVQLAERFLPTTAMAWGRPLNGHQPTHRLYRIEEDMTVKNRALFERPNHGDRGQQDNKPEMLIELRYHRHQSMCPPSWHPDGDPVQWMAVGEPTRIRYSELLRAVEMIAATVLIARNWPGPESHIRHSYVMALAGVFARRGLAEDVAAELFAAAGDVVGDSDPNDRAAAVHGTYQRLAEGGEVTGIPTAKEYFVEARDFDKLLEWLDLDEKPASKDPEHALHGADGFALTDLGNGERLVAHAGDRLRWVPKWNKWIVWDGVAWRPDESGQAQQLRTRAIRSMLTVAQSVDDTAERNLLLGWALKSESGRHPDVMLEHAKVPSISVTPGDLNKDKMLLNCLNGVIDLRTGELLPHDAKYLMTKTTAVAYRPEATSELFDEYLAAVFPDPDLRAYVQRAVGYSLTGSVQEKVFFLCVGSSNTGKTTLLEAVGRALGDYACAASMDTFMKDKQGGSGGGIRNDIARLDGARFVRVAETDEGQRLKLGLIKSLTGSDTITARFLHNENFDFESCSKLWFGINDRPQVPSSDDGVWTRIREIPFDFKLVNADMSFEQRQSGQRKQAILLDVEQSGEAILAWAVAGCLAWMREGLREPSAVQQACEAYRDEARQNDPAQQFIEECLVAGDHGDYVSARDVKQMYKDWQFVRHEKYAPGPMRFAQVMKDAGFQEDNVWIGRGEHKKRTRVWRGIRIIKSLDRLDSVDHEVISEQELERREERRQKRELVERRNKLVSKEQRAALRAWVRQHPPSVPFEECDLTDESLIVLDVSA